MNTKKNHKHTSTGYMIAALREAHKAVAAEDRAARLAARAVRSTQR